MPMLTTRLGLKRRDVRDVIRPNLKDALPNPPATNSLFSFSIFVSTRSRFTDVASADAAWSRRRKCSAA